MNYERYFRCQKTQKKKWHQKSSSAVSRRIVYHILAEKRTCAGQHRQNLLNKCPNMKKEHLSSLGPFFFLFLLPFFTCTVQPTCSRIKCMVLISCVHGIKKLVYLLIAFHPILWSSELGEKAHCVKPSDQCSPSPGSIRWWEKTCRRKRLSLLT